MTRLLVSVRSAGEALDALEGGADLIDVKEPDRGSLGAASPQTIAEVVQAVAGRAPLSVALGELQDADPSVAAAVPAGVAYAKLGLSGCRSQAGWAARWQEAVRHLPRSVAAVGVVYADWCACGAPSPEEVLREAVLAGCRAVLVDTFDKSGGTLAERWPGAETSQFVQAVHSSGMLAVLGGALDDTTIPPILRLEPDYVAVRGAVCPGGRTGLLDRARVAHLASLITHVGRRESRGSCGSCLTFREKTKE